MKVAMYFEVVTMNLIKYEQRFLKRIKRETVF